MNDLSVSNGDTVLTIDKRRLNLPNWVGKNAELRVSPEAWRAIATKKLTLSLGKLGKLEKIDDFGVEINALHGTIKILFGNDGANVKIGKVSGCLDLRLFRTSRVIVGDKTTCSYARLICDNSEIAIGEDCLLSDEIILQSADQHAIFDLKKNEIVNAATKSIILGDHVWMGRRSCALGGARIGNGCIVAFGALATKVYPEHCLITGVPGRVTKDGVTWSRTSVIDEYCMNQVSTFATPLS